MRLLYLPLLLLSTACFAQQTTSYVVESRTEQNNDALNSLSTYLSIQMDLSRFWGIWCAPCVAEMPKLNAFHEALKADELRSQKINFLTIACHDTEEKVKDFLTKNNYNIPVLMSDGEVQQHFKVTGYPSKYIISPEGKLLNIPFGFDWQPFLDHLAQL